MGFASSAKIEIGGEEIIDFLSFDIDQKMHDLQEFTITCRMDTFENPDDSILNASKKFVGATAIIKIETFNAGWQESSPGFIYKGLIYSVKAIKSETDKEDLIVLSGYSPECMLNNNAGCRSFENKTLKQIVEAVLKPYFNDVLARNVNPVYTDQIPYCVKYNENNLDFLKRLAARHGEWMFYDGKEFIFGKSNGNQEDLVLGMNLLTLDFSINMKAPGFKYISYNYMSAEAIETTANKNMGKMQLNEVGKTAHDTSWKQMGQTDSQFFPHLNVPTGNETKAQNDSVDTKASGTSMNMCQIKGTSENMKLMAGTKITIKEPKQSGAGEIDYGEYIITSIQHKCDNLLNYKNSFTALPAEAKIPPYANPELVPTSPSQSAKVMNNSDPEKLGRIKVHFFWQEEGQTSDWIRVVNPYSGGDRGFFFIPEPDDEVLVGFDAGNAERPFVIGSLYNGSNKPNSAWPNDNNNFKGLVTNSGLRMEFDEEKKITSLDTPAGNRVVISDDQGLVKLSDESGNSVELSSGGITLNSSSDITLTAQGKIFAEADSNMDFTTASGKIKMEAIDIEQKATVEFKAEGGVNAEIKSDVSVAVKATAGATIDGGATTTIKGGLIKIN